MAKPCYEEYANHAMRFYAKNPALNMRAPGLKSADITNWIACNEIMRTLTESQQAIVIGIYKSKCPITDAVKGISSQLGVSENSVWQLLTDVAKRFAKKRNLV